ncbi:nicotinate-nucleotide--dimethylbenzimidazole phosphoribosyltransferase [Benzoatithermus flavus]|uniref:Nicotinate-nucleotide--dimethylbenzimidazole phosphoribosyltransferase n=1 Tax=Benzoatithermus flavus TaxID=3108223 RepID=A0ABU8XK36_9PROT
MSTLTPVSSFDDLRSLVRQLPQPDTAAAEACRRHEAELTKPAGALGRLEELTCWLSAWQGRHPPRLDRVLILVFVGWHEIAKHKVSAYPAEVTDQMVLNFQAGGAAINQLARLAGAELQVIPVGQGRPAHDFTRRPAMSEAGCVRALNIGLSAVPEDIDLLAIGEMGIANTTAAAAIAAGLYGEPATAWTGPGTGLDTSGVAHKAEVIQGALDRHRAALKDPLEVLRYVGGRELAAMLGAILAARLRRVPVILDGFTSTVPAAVLQALDPASIEHCRSGHCSAEPGHRRLLDRIGQRPLLELGMRLGEASGAAVALQLVRAAVACHNGMATFESAGVSRKR